jgi:hypothetical protein
MALYTSQTLQSWLQLQLMQQMQLQLTEQLLPQLQLAVTHAHRCQQVAAKTDLSHAGELRELLLKQH